jgi:hypothetical protein
MSFATAAVLGSSHRNLVRAVASSRAFRKSFDASTNKPERDKSLRGGIVSEMPHSPIRFAPASTLIGAPPFIVSQRRETFLNYRIPI